MDDGIDRRVFIRKDKEEIGPRLYCKHRCFAGGIPSRPPFAADALHFKGIGDHKARKPEIFPQNVADDKRRK